MSITELCANNGLDYDELLGWYSFGLDAGGRSTAENYVMLEAKNSSISDSELLELLAALEADTKQTLYSNSIIEE